MTLKTDVETREGLVELGIFSEEEIEAKVGDMLAKGTIVPYKAPAEPTDTEAELKRLDELALNWELEKGGDEDEDECHEEPDGDEYQPDDEGDGDGDEDDADGGAKMVAKALTDTLSGPLQTLAKAITNIGERQKRSEAKVMRRMTRVGDTVNGLLDITRADLAKGSRDNGVGAIVARIDSLEKALGRQITAPRGDYRGMRADEFAAIKAGGDDQPADKTLVKGIDPRALANHLLAEQRKAIQEGDQNKASALHKAVTTIDQTTPNAELAQYATQYGFPIPQ